MVAVTEDILQKVQETNMLLNSNLMDARQSVNEGKAVSREILAELGTLNKGIEKNLYKAKVELTEQLDKLDQDLIKELNNATKKSLNAISNEHADLTKTVNQFQGTLQTLMDKHQQKQDQQFQSLQVILNKNSSEQKEILKEIEKNLLVKIDLSLVNQNRLSAKIGDLSHSLNKYHEEQVKKVVEENLQLKKFQKKWYITTFIAILLGYFL